MKNNWEGELKTPSIENLTSQMESLYRKYQKTDDEDKITEIMDNANKIISFILEGMKKGYYKKNRAKPVLDLHKKIVVGDK